MDEVFFGAEDEAAHARMQPVRADDDIEAAYSGVVEDDVVSARILNQRSDRVIEEILRPITHGLVRPSRIGRRTWLAEQVAGVAEDDRTSLDRAVTILRALRDEAPTGCGDHSLRQVGGDEARVGHRGLR